MTILAFTFILGCALWLADALDSVLVAREITAKPLNTRDC